MFIPNDIESGPQETRKLKILTGPNASGKTIYLKQVALCVYMTMIGSYVAGKNVECGDFDRIFTRLYSNECVTYEMSAFAFDMKQIADALNFSTKKSLLILDEVGKGTRIELGKAMVFSLIKNWTECDAEKLPHVYLSTHFYDLFYQVMRGNTTIQNNFEKFIDENNLIWKVVNDKRIEYFTFDFMFDNEKSKHEMELSAQISNDQPSSLVFLYKLKYGITSSSYALNIAKSVGLPDEIIKKAEQVLNILIKCTQIQDDKISNDQIRILREKMDSLFTSDVTVNNLNE
jgi:DNA mismatch repair protein MSH5